MYATNGYEFPSAELYGGDCLDVLARLEADSIETCITDPPYGLEFMGKEWDRGVPGKVFWVEVLRVLKPGAMLLAFGGTRTWHRLAVAIEDAGFEIRDTIAWLYGSGFPKSYNIGKGIDKAMGAERELGELRTDGRGKWELKMQREAGDTGIGHADGSKQVYRESIPATPEAQQWQGWGTALKPAFEPIIVAMKPIEGTFAENALKHGVAGINVDGGRIGVEDMVAEDLARGRKTSKNVGIWGNAQKTTHLDAHSLGRWPANVILDEGAAEALDEQSGVTKSKASMRGELHGNIYGGGKGPSGPDSYRGHNDSGGASRFFYVAKASKAERNAGLEGMGTKEKKVHIRQSDNRTNAGKMVSFPVANHHPTVKPLDLMRYLCILTNTPERSTVLDPFMGSGTTGMAAIMENRNFIGIELDPEYLKIAQNRIEWAKDQSRQLALF